MRKLSFLFLCFLLFSCRPDGDGGVKNLKILGNNEKISDPNLSQVLIYGGKKASQEVGQHLVFLPTYHKQYSFKQYAVDSNYWSGCSGSLLLFQNQSQSQWILTAAHCVKPNEKMAVVFPNQNTQSYNESSKWCEINSSDIHTYPKWNAASIKGNLAKQEQEMFPNDMALVKLPSGCNRPSWIKPLPVIQDPSQIKEAVIYLAGFGETNKNVPDESLRNSKSIQMLSFEGTQAHLKEVKTKEGRLVSYWQVITGKDKGLFFGDSGGPLIGVYPDGRKAIGGCLSAGSDPRVNSGNQDSNYANILSGVNWIERTTGQSLVRLRGSPKRTVSNSSKAETCLWVYFSGSSKIWIKFQNQERFLSLPNYKNLLFISVIDEKNSHYQNGFVGLDYYIDLEKNTAHAESQPLWIRNNYLQNFQRVCFEGSLKSPWR